MEILKCFVNKHELHELVLDELKNRATPELRRMSVWLDFQLPDVPAYTAWFRFHSQTWGQSMPPFVRHMDDHKPTEDPSYGEGIEVSKEVAAELHKVALEFGKNAYDAAYAQAKQRR
jgi:hypothetical protein